jgi:uncharacterized protein (TIGR01370 family)
MKYRIVLSFGVLVSLLVCFGGCGDRNNRDGDMKAPYGVFVGTGPEDADMLLGCRLAVIDAAYFSETEIEMLHKSGTKVCSYLNIGSVETFRDDYAAYQRLILGEYENWPDEYWVDVSQPEWQAHILSEAGSLADKGVDGFFLDNADVYYHYPKTEIFQGLIAVVDGLAQYGKDILINGGDVFVTEAILDADAPRVRITGVNQECVFTNVDFENNKATRQSPVVTEYYQAYLERCKAAGLSVYLTEYDENPESDLRKILDAYCEKRQFTYFISPSVSLDQ